MDRRIVIGFLGLLSACRATPAMRAATSGDRIALAREIEVKHRVGKLTNGEARRLARAVATYELNMSDIVHASQRIRETAPCACALEGALSARAQEHDAVGADAAMALLEAGEFGSGKARKFAADPDDGWRAVGVRALTRGRDRASRHQAMVDGSPAVRRAAVRAAIAADDPAGADVLLEVARLDPEVSIRTEAVRALSLGDSDWPDGIVGRLRAVWDSAEDGALPAIAGAWASPSLFDRGGRDALQAVILTEKGLPTVAGSGSFLARETAGDVALSDRATVNLERALTQGGRSERLAALNLVRLKRPCPASAPLQGGDDSLCGAVYSLSRSVDDEIRLSALLRLAESGDGRVQQWIEDDLASSEPKTRLAALRALSALGRASRGAVLLTDLDAGVRSEAACILISAVGR